METIANCPICDSNQAAPFLTCKDYTVSQKEFTVVQCASCGFKYTSPRPEEKDLGAYYESEEYISHSNTSKGLVNSVYQLVRKYTIIKKVQLVNNLNRNKGRLLDIGSGTGEFLNLCKANSWNVTGIEPSETARNYAIENYELDIKTEDQLSLFPDASFDIITMWHVLEHVPKLNEQVAHIHRLLKESGIAVIAVPNCSSLDAEIYEQYWAAYDVPRHLYHFTPKDIQALFAKQNMRVSRVLPMRFDSFYVSMLSEKYKTGKTNLLRAVWNGFRSNINGIKTGKRFSSQIYIIVK